MKNVMIIKSGGMDKRSLRSLPMVIAKTILAANSRFRYPEARFAGLLGLVAMSLLAAPPVSGQCLYEATIIQGPMCTNGSPATFGPSALDEQGNAAGASSCFLASHATVWTGSGLAWPLPDSGESQALAILDPDHVVGRVDPAGGNALYMAAYWLNGQEIILPLLPGANTSQAGGINSSLQIVGMSNNNVASGEMKAFQWQSGQIEALQLPLGLNEGAVANDINQNGEITGWMGAVFTSNAYVYANGQTTTLPHFPGGQATIGSSINVHGQVVGLALIDVPDVGLTRHAYYWNGVQAIDLGTLPDHKRSVAKDINDLDEIVGASSFVGSNINTSHAVYWRDGVMYDLNDLVVTDLGGSTLLRAWAINNAGQILADIGGAGVLLTPIGSAPGDIDNNCFVNVNDLLLLLGEWGEAGSVADINLDGTVNVTDLLALLGSWG